MHRNTLSLPAPVARYVAAYNVSCCVALQSPHWLQVMLMLDSAAGVKDRAARDSICVILASAALRYRQLDSVAAALVDLLNKHEHMAGLCAELAQYAAIKCDDAQLVRDGVWARWLWAHT